MDSNILSNIKKCLLNCELKIVKREMKPEEKGQTAKIQATVVVENKVKTEAKMKQIIGEGQYEKQGEEHHHCW